LFIKEKVTRVESLYSRSVLDEIPRHVHVPRKGKSHRLINAEKVGGEAVLGIREGRTESPEN